MKKPRIAVSDHAVLRYMERAMGLDVDAVRAEIAAKVRLAEEHPGCTAILAEGLRFRIENGVVVTVLLRGGRR